ncbi:glutamate racemase [Prochlorococcus marinus str. MIT 9312]|uniref:Glutamate racemase n=1 Tax=Prochlorococcus marinus (strain MIT 9312) TaxID=74546 RepID=Q31BR7_PROM9|nr:glutamate racemase [Prochlorococcus marinus]ABB49678.1 glutamate racemase [Prochlorococcus marinus str. MIT 9312]KGF99359.1 Glutamate racemase [Prochlorococcus marinus str. MIT 9311]
MKLKIGIFDSGIGGFTILNSLLKTRNDVEVFYLADTKRIPFGDKNFEEIRLIAKEICNFFEDKNLDALLIACNTTNACALDILENDLKIPCFDLINSVSEIVNKQIIGILATKTTVRSSYYKNAISSKKENSKIFQNECPEFVSEIEREKLDFIKLNNLSDLYLKPLLNKNIEEIILGCSHYPLIYEFLRKKISSNIKIIDPSEALIKKFNESFAIPKTDRYESLSFENVKFFVTSERDKFSKKVKFWLGINKEISLVNLRSNV